MKKSTKIWLLVATLWPIFYSLCFVIFVFALVFSVLPQGEPPPPTPGWIVAIFPIHFLTILLCLGLSVIYIIHAVKSKKVPKQQLVLWILLLVLGGILAMIVYWVLFIWREPKASPVS
jgi:hypothetical protein